MDPAVVIGVIEKGFPVHCVGLVSYETRLCVSEVSRGRACVFSYTPKLCEYLCFPVISLQNYKIATRSFGVPDGLSCNTSFVVGWHSWRTLTRRWLSWRTHLNLRVHETTKRDAVHKWVVHKRMQALRVTRAANNRPAGRNPSCACGFFHATGNKAAAPASAWAEQSSCLSAARVHLRCHRAPFV